MVLLHVARTLRYAFTGEFLQTKTAPFEECVTKVFVGVRKMDGFMHVNNSRYLEMMEFARYNQGGRAGWNKRFISSKIWPVIGSVHIHYMTQIAPWRFVNVHTRLAGYEGRYLHIHQDIRSADDKILHATALFRVAMVHKNKTMELDDAMEKLGFPKQEDGRMNEVFLACSEEHRKKYPMFKRLIDADDEWRQSVRDQIKAERAARKHAKEERKKNKE